jgi:hypothetical protein
VGGGPMIQINKFNSDYENIWTQDFNINTGTSDKTLFTTVDDHIVVAVFPDNIPGIAKLNSESTFTDVCDEFSINNATNVSNFPNPFNPTTAINFSIQNNSQVELSIFNVKGQKVKILANNEFTKGSHSFNWNGVDELNNPVSSGVYLYKLNVDGKTEVMKKCLLLK